jgi:adenosylhomocysteinase
MRSEVKDWASQRYRVDLLSRHQLADVDIVKTYVDTFPSNHKIVILDIGGYFANCVSFLSQYLGSRLLGIVEDTENGHLRYIANRDLPCPVISVARSELKGPEDFLVGQSIVFSVEALLREQGDILHGRTACVVGYGKVGRSIAALLNSRHVSTVIYDTNSVRLVEAMSHGYFATTDLSHALSISGLVFCATGHLSLSYRDFCALSKGAYVASVTSSEDELDLDSLKGAYSIKHVGDHITLYSRKGHHFYILNRGQAVNFIHGAAVGPFIYLVHGEIIASMRRLIEKRLKPGLQEIPQSVKKQIAACWAEHFSQRKP